jgi:nucleoside-diphosphate-sugar epimerase
LAEWITDRLATASFYEERLLGKVAGSILVDVRDLVDREGNDPALLRQKIAVAIETTRAGQSVVVCCDRGVSRSNAIALGVLMSSGMSFDASISLLRKKLGAIEINLGLLQEVRSLFEPRTAAARPRTKNLLVTGATGFIGSAVIPTFAPAYKVTCLDRQKLDLTRDLQLLDAFISDREIGFVVHLAHPRMRNNASALPESVAMMRNILEVCRLNRVGVLFLSSLTIFSGHISNGVLEADSSLAPRPKGLYGETKLLCEHLIRVFQDNYGLETILLRPAALYGKEMDRAAFLSKFLEAARQGRTIYTHRYRNGAPMFDFLHIDDLVAAIRRALEIRPVTPVNLGTGVGTSTYDLARKIARLTGSSSSVQFIEIHDDTCKIIASREEAQNLLGWRAKIDLDSGLKELCHDAPAPGSIAVS